MASSANVLNSLINRLGISRLFERITNAMSIHSNEIAADQGLDEEQTFFESITDLPPEAQQKRIRQHSWKIDFPERTTTIAEIEFRVDQFYRDRYL